MSASAGPRLKPSANQRLSGAQGLCDSPRWHRLRGRYRSGRVAVFSRVAAARNYRFIKALSPTSVELTGEVDPAGGGEVTECAFEDGEEVGVNDHPSPANRTAFAGKEEVHADLSGLKRRDHLPLTTSPPLTPTAPRWPRSHLHSPSRHRSRHRAAHRSLAGTAATFNGSLLGDGTQTHYFFEWGTTPPTGKGPR